MVTRAREAFIPVLIRVCRGYMMAFSWDARAAVVNIDICGSSCERTVETPRNSEHLFQLPNSVAPEWNEALVPHLWVKLRSTVALSKPWPDPLSRPFQ
jgi:hypothetical protein